MTNDEQRGAFMTLRQAIDACKPDIIGTRGATGIRHGLAVLHAVKRQNETTIVIGWIKNQDGQGNSCYSLTQTLTDRLESVLNTDYEWIPSRP